MPALMALQESMLGRPATLSVLARHGLVSEKTWVVIDRELVDAGLIERRKRGSGATPLRPRETAALLLAGMGTDSPAKGPAIVRQLQAARSARFKKDAAPSVLRRALRCSTFGEAIEALLEDMPKISALLEKKRDALFSKLWPNKPELYPDPARFRRGLCYMTVEVDRKLKSASISYYETKHWSEDLDATEHVFAGQEWEVEYDDDPRGGDMYGGWETEVRVYDDVLAALVGVESEA